MLLYSYIIYIYVILLGQEQLGHRLGGSGIRQDRQERGEHVRRRLGRQLSPRLIGQSPAYWPLIGRLVQLLEQDSHNATMYILVYSYRDIFIPL